MKKKIFSVILAGALMLSAPAVFAKDMVMKIAHGDADNEISAYQILAETFAKNLEETGSKIKVEIYPGGQLGAEQRAFQDVQMGIVQACILASNNAAVFSNSLSVLDLPFLFTSKKEFEEVMIELGPRFSDIMQKESKTMPVVWGIQGFRVLANSKRPIETMEDLHGVKIRVPNNPVQIASFKSWDSEPIGMAFSELFSALQQRVVDGLEMTYTALAAMKMYEVVDNVTDLRYKMAINPMVVSQAWFNSLPAEEQANVLAAGEKTTSEVIARATALEDKGKEILLANGVTLSPQPKDEEKWIEQAMSVWPQFYSYIPDKEIVADVMKVLKREAP